MDKLKQEYNAFGPWIIEIKKTDDIPPFFSNQFEIGNDDYIIKIPIEIERRVAKPGMHLYNMVLILENTRLILLERANETVKKSEINFDQIISIKNTNNLLKGNLEFITENKTFLVSYNVASNKIIDNIITIIRNKKELKDKSGMLPFDKKNNIELSFFFKNLLEQIQNKEDIKLLDFQNTMKIKRARKSIISMIKDTIHNPYSRTTMLLTNNKELIVVNADSSSKKDRIGGYSYTHYYIPLNEIRSINISKHNVFTNINSLNINLGNTIFSFDIDKEKNMESLIKAF